MPDIIVRQPDLALWIILAGAVVLLFCSGFVSASEIAFFSLTPKDEEQLEDSKHRVDKQITRLRAESERLLATVLISNNLVNVAIVILLNYFCAQTFDFGGSEFVQFLCVTVVLTFLLLLFGEIIPKVYSAQNPLRFCRAAAPVFTGLTALLRPFSSLLMKSQGLTSKIVRHQVEALTVDDLEQALELTDKDDIAPETQMLQGIIRFGDEMVKEVMTPRVDLIDIEYRTPFDEVLRLIIDKGYSRLPVFSQTEDNIKGVLYTKDLLPHLAKPASFKWQSLIRPPFFVPETKMVDDLLRDFQQNKVHIAIVVDEFGGTSGIVTMEDILEEIVGEINDEYDDQKKPYLRLNQHTYLFEGKTLLVDVTRMLHLPDDFFEEGEGDAETIAGLILELKGDFPQQQEKIPYRHLTLQPTEMDGRRIVRVKLIVGKE